MKKSFIIAVTFGVVAVAGVILYVVNSEKNNEVAKKQKPIKKESLDKKVAYSNLNERKDMVASTVLNRHNTAAQIIRETVDEENIEKSESKHKDDFDEIDSGLSNLLDEE